MCVPPTRGNIVMHVIRNRPSRFALTSLVFLLAGAGVATAQELCFPHCDYAHYYGPFDFTYVRPGLFGHLHHCGPQGDCSPQLALTSSVVPRGRITVRFPRMAGPRTP
jgi:hypothetical protein